MNTQQRPGQSTSVLGNPTYEMQKSCNYPRESCPWKAWLGQWGLRCEQQLCGRKSMRARKCGERKRGWAQGRAPRGRSTPFSSWGPVSSFHSKINCSRGESLQFLRPECSALIWFLKMCILNLTPLLITWGNLTGFQFLINKITC